MREDITGRLVNRQTPMVSPIVIGVDYGGGTETAIKGLEKENHQS